MVVDDAVLRTDEDLRDLFVEVTKLYGLELQLKPTEFGKDLRAQVSVARTKYRRRRGGVKSSSGPLRTSGSSSRRGDGESPMVDRPDEGFRQQRGQRHGLRPEVDPEMLNGAAFDVKPQSTAGVGLAELAPQRTGKELPYG